MQEPQLATSQGAASGHAMAPRQQPSISYIPASPETDRNNTQPWQTGSFSGSHIGTQGHSHPLPPGASSLPYYSHPHSLPNHNFQHPGAAARTSFSDGDAASSRSSLVFNPYYFGGNNRSWVNEGSGTPVEVQDVQLGSSGAVAQNTGITQGYFNSR